MVRQIINKQGMYVSGSCYSNIPVTYSIRNGNQRKFPRQDTNIHSLKTQRTLNHLTLCFPSPTCKAPCPEAHLSIRERLDTAFLLSLSNVAAELAGGIIAE